MSRVPRVSIGMPAYNGEATLRNSIDSLLVQSFEDFELIVSDNASTDGTWALVQEYMRQDPRVVGLRQPYNIGANGNYSAVFQAARGHYFKWASSNDYCAPQFLNKCVSYLDAHPQAVLVAPRTRLFQDSAENFSEYTADIACLQPTPLERLTHLGQHLALNNAFNGLMRSDLLRRTCLVEHYPGADIVLMGHLALLGQIALLDEPLFYRRMDAATATRLMSLEAVHRHHYPTATAKALFPAWRMALGWIRVVCMARLSATETTRGLWWAAHQAYWNKAALAHDLVVALKRA
jgi:glycosyltransferase involved in cell wall biosynthesis